MPYDLPNREKQNKYSQADLLLFGLTEMSAEALKICLMEFKAQKWAKQQHANLGVTIKNQTPDCCL